MFEGSLWHSFSRAECLVVIRSIALLQAGKLATTLLEGQSSVLQTDQDCLTLVRYMGGVTIWATLGW